MHGYEISNPMRYSLCYIGTLRETESGRRSTRKIAERAESFTTKTKIYTVMRHGWLATNRWLKLL